MNIYSIAKELGLSPRTISRAINDSPLVSDKTKTRVLNHFTAVGYSPNQTAKSLIQQKTDAIGIATLASHSSYLHELLLALHQIISAHGKRISLFVSSDPEGERRAIQNLIAKGVDGMICLTALQTDDEIRRLAASGRSIVFGQGPVELQAVRTSQVEGIHEILSLLKGLGHQRIHMLGLTEGMYPGKNERHAAYLDWMSVNGLSHHAKIITTQPSLSAAFATSKIILKDRQRPTALMCFNDEMAISALHAAHELKIAVPKDLSITGFDGTQIGQYTNPCLTTYRINPEDVAKALTDSLFKMIAKPGSAVSKHFITGNLLLGRSTAMAR